LNEDEKQNLAFARVLLQRPRWLVIDGTLDKLNPAARRRLETFLKEEPGTGLVNIASESSQHGFFTRKLRLVTDPHGPTFNPADHCVTAAA
jgi:putative ATP-binding cassette transporter